ncbi:hypothetical protein D3C79_749700 [compost metagenome]
MPDIMPWHLTELLNPQYTRVDLVKEGANSQAKIMLYKSKGGNVMNFVDLMKTLKPEHVSIIEAHIAGIEKAKDDDIDVITKAKEAAEEALQNAQIEKTASGQSEEEIIKSIKDPALRTLMETQVAKTKAAEAEVRKAREATLNTEAVSKARELEGIGSDNETLVGIYKSLSDLDTEIRDQVFGVLKAAKNVQEDGSLTTEIGKSVKKGPVMSEEDAWGAIEAAAAEIQKSANTSKESAIQKAIENNPELYQAYLRAQNGY